MHDLRFYGLKPWDYDHMFEVDRMSTDGTGLTVHIELWWFVFNEHANCPPQCMGAKGLKCVLFPPDRERFEQGGLLDDRLRTMQIWEDCFTCKRVSWRPAIMEMSDSDFEVWHDHTELWHTFRLNPFMTGQDFLDLLVAEFGPVVHDSVLMVGDEELNKKLSLLMQGIHEGFNAHVTPLVLMHNDYD
jgi:hypothetical protein